MRKVKLALCLIVFALIIFVAVMTANKWNFKRLSTKEYVTNTYEITEVFSNVQIKVETADVEILLSQDGKCKIEAYEEKERKHNVETSSQSLIINPPKKEILPSIFDFNDPKITIYLPKTEYELLSIDATTGDIKIDSEFTFKFININVTTGDVENLASVKENIKIKTTTGDVTLDNISANNIDVSLTTGETVLNNVNSSGNITISKDTGKTTLTNIICSSLISNGTTGKITLNNVIATEKFDLKRTTGDITLNNCDANEIYIKVTTGDVKGNLLSGKSFDVNSTTGDKNVPNTTGGICKIDTTTGDIIITISQNE